MTLAKDYITTAADLSSVVTSVNNMAARYGVAGYTEAITAGNTSILTAQVTSLYNILNTCNSHSRNYSKVTLTDITGYSVGNLIYSNVLSLIQSKANSVYSTYCSCNCDDCDCNCDRYYCSCNCDRCSCVSDTCYCDHGNQYTCPCFLPGQKIYTSNGIKNIEDIKYGDYVLTGTGTYGKVLATWKSSAVDKTVIVYKGDSFEMPITEEHLIPLFNSKVLFPKIKISPYYSFTENTRIENKLIALLPYFLEFGESGQYGTTVYTKDIEIKEKIKNELSEVYPELKFDITKELISITGYIGELPFNEVLGSLLNNGLPDLVYGKHRDTMTDIINSFESIGYTKKENIIYQYKLLYILLGIEARLVKKGDAYTLETIGPLKSNDEYYFFDIKSIDRYAYTGTVYNLVTENGTVVSDVLVGDGYSKKVI